MSISPIQTKYRSYMAKPGLVAQNWYHVDASGKVVGRLAAAIAKVLMGKHRPEYTPHLDTGEFVIVTNCRGLVVTGKKFTDKAYQYYSGYPSGLREVSFRDLLQKNPTEVLRRAVKRMLPRNRLGAKMLTKLKLFGDDKHPHEAQQPKPFTFAI